MYVINGVELDNESHGWYMLRLSQPLTPLIKGLSNVAVPGRHGVLTGVPSFNEPSSNTIVLRCTDVGLESLYSLFTRNGGQGTLQLSDDLDRAIQFELASIEPQGINAEDELINVSVTVRYPTSMWRSTALTTLAPVTLTNPVTTHTMFPGISADVSDADFFISGNFGNFELRDEGSGSWVKTILPWPNVAGTGLLFVGATGQAFRAQTTNPWVPVADMSRVIDVSGGGGFRMTPTWVTDPSARLASLKLTTTNQSGVTFGARGFNSYAVRNGGI